MLNYIEGRQRVDYAYECTLPREERPAQPQLDSAEIGGGRATQGKDPEDSEEVEPSDAEPPPNKKARRSSKTPAKVIGYAKQTLSKVTKW